MRFFRTDDRPYKEIMNTGFEPGSYWKTGKDEAHNLFNYLLTRDQSLNHYNLYADRKSVKQNNCMAKIYETTKITENLKDKNGKLIKDDKSGSYKTRVKYTIPINYDSLSSTIKYYGRGSWKLCPFFSTSLGTPKVAASANTYYFDLNVKIYYVKNKILYPLNSDNFPVGIKTSFVLDNKNIDNADFLAFLHAGDGNSIKNCEASFFTPVPGNKIYHVKHLTKAPKKPGTAIY